MKKKCLRIIATAKFPTNFLTNYIKKNAQKLGIEGTAQLIDSKAKTIRITVCGVGQALDDFIDLFHEATERIDLETIEIEPFLKDKDYRNVFRVIE